MHHFWRVIQRYEGKINIINRSEGREIYDVTKIKSIKANEVLNGEEFLAAQLDTFYTTSVSQKEENATDLVKKSLKDFNTSIDLDREYEGISFGEAAGILGTVTEKLKHTKIDTVERCTIFGGSFNSNGSV